MIARAEGMARSDNAQRRKAGEQMLSLANGLMNDTTFTVTLFLDRFADNHTSGRNMYINISSTQFDDRPLTVLLAHEVGHAHRMFVENKPNTFWQMMNPLSGAYQSGVRSENLMRTYYGCPSRLSHSTDGPGC
jgi:hypothetical protein